VVEITPGHGNFEMWRVLILMAVLVAGILPSYARRGPAFPTEANRGPAFPKSVSPTDRNELNWIVSPRDYTPIEFYQQLWAFDRQWARRYGWRGWRRWRW